jgi:hypothetical protein
LLIIGKYENEIKADEICARWSKHERNEKHLQGFSANWWEKTTWKTLL